MARITKPKRRWFEMVGDPDGARVEIKALTPGERQDVAAASLDVRLIYDADEDSEQKLKAEQHVNPKAEAELKAKIAVVAWDNFYDELGNPLECTEKNVLRAIREIDGFSVFVNNSLNRLHKDLNEEAREQEKN